MGKVLVLTEWSYSFLFWLLTTLGFYLVGVGAWLMVRGVAEKYAEKRQNVLITFTKCTIHDKTEDNRASVAKMMGGERQRQRRGTRLACARWRKKRKPVFLLFCEKPSFLLYIGNVTTLLQADYRYITKAAKALTSGGYMNKMEAYEYKHE